MMVSELLCRMSGWIACMGAHKDVACICVSRFCAGKHGDVVSLSVEQAMLSWSVGAVGSAINVDVAGDVCDTVRCSCMRY